MMQTPGDYFDDRREADLADRVWDLTLTLSSTQYHMHGIHDAFAKLPWVNQRIILARDWITQYREADGRGGASAVNRELGGTDFTAGEIGNVEHFYVSAMIGTIGGPGAGPVLNSAATGAWELLIGPARIGWSKRNESLEVILDYMWTNLQHNFEQFAGPDFEGMRFGSMYPLMEAYDALLP